MKVSKLSIGLDKLSTEQNNTENKISKPQTVRRSERIKHLPAKSYSEEYDDLNSYLSIASTSIKTVPKFYHEISERDDKDKWLIAIKEEIHSLQTNETWSLVKKSKDKNVVSCKWVFTIKKQRERRTNQI